MDEEKKPVNKKGLIVVLAVVGILALLAASFVIITQLSQYKNSTLESNKTTVAPKETPAYLYFSSPSIKLLQRTQKGITSDIILDTQGKSVAVVQMELAFDSGIISNLSISKTDDTTSPFTGFKVDQAVANQAAGKAFITLSISNTDTPKTGKGKLATVKYDVVNKSNKEKTVITITPLTALINLGREVKFEKTDIEVDFSQVTTNPQ